jgi:mannose-6-phosphate isomerase-like protein (cupin superfamily)
MRKINIAATFDDDAPRNALAEIARVNDMCVKVARFKGRFTWHRHDREDELFWVMRGRLTLQLRDRDVVLDAGELFVVPAGVEHRSVAESDADVIVMHPTTTVLPPAQPDG